MVTGLMAVRSIPYMRLAIPLQLLPDRLLSSPFVHVSVSLSVWTLWTSKHLSRINPNLIYCICFLFCCRTLTLQFVVSKWSNICPCWQFTILFVWPQARCVAILHQVISKNLAFRLYHNIQWPLCNIVWNSITCVILHHVPNINLIFPKVNSKILHPQFSNFTSLHPDYIVSHPRRKFPSPCGVIYFFLIATTSKLLSLSSKSLSLPHPSPILSLARACTHKLLRWQLKALCSSLYVLVRELWLTSPQSMAVLANINVVWV